MSSLATLWYQSRINADAVRMALLIVDQDLLGYSLLAGGTGYAADKTTRIAQAANKVNQAVGYANYVQGAMKALLAAKLFPFVIPVGEVYPQYGFLHSPTTDQEWTADKRYELEQINHFPQILVQVHGRGYAISLSIVLVMTAIYRCDPEDVEPDPEVYESPVDVPVWARPGKMHVPKLGLWGSSLLSVAASVSYGGHLECDMIPALSWAWSGQVLPYWHILLNGDGEYYIDEYTGLLRYKIVHTNGALTGFTSRNDIYAGIMTDEYHSMIQGGVLHNYHTSWMQFAAVPYGSPVIIVPPVRRVQGGVTVPVSWAPLFGAVLPDFAGRVWGHVRYNAALRNLTLGGEPLTIDGEELNL